MELNLYAIQHTPTGYFMPERKGTRGYTNDTPKLWLTHTPRLFRTARAARNALTWWLKGTTMIVWGGEYHDETHLKTTPQSGRNAEDMAVVPVYLRAEVI